MKRFRNVKIKGYLFEDTKGFTLIELIVVISLMGTLLFLVLPRFQINLIGDASKKASLWIMVKVQGLKQQALRDQKDFVLHISTGTGKMWISHEAMKEEELMTAEQNAFSLPEGLRVIDVEFSDKIVSFGTADIRIYKEGYSDKVMIHIEDDDHQAYSFLIEPFLGSVKRYEQYVTFED